MKETSKAGEELRAVYLVGIGGIGMSAIARYFHAKGVRVGGYDKTPTQLTRELEQSGISVHYTDDPDLAPRDVDLVVYTPAIPADHRELNSYREQGYRVVKRSDVLQIITASSFNVCIAGTHGKTTITTMVAHLLRDSGYGCNAFLGGIAVNYGTNFWSDPRNVCVIEADEYDRSFLKLSPDVAIITSMDPDHLDIYGTAEAVEQAFVDFSQRLKPGGLLVARKGLKRAADLNADRRLWYSRDDQQADVFAADLRIDQGSYLFDVQMPGGRIGPFRLNMGGLHNVENAVAAIAVAASLEIPVDKIRQAVASFRGVRRRFEYVWRTENCVFIDDYAHHPEELRALITGAQNLYAGWKCTVLFQPHLYTRTRDQADGFAEVLDTVDEVVLLPIYPARELPIAGVSSEMILAKMHRANRSVVEKAKLAEWIGTQTMPALRRGEKQVLITCGAGDIDTLVAPIREILEKGVGG